MRARCQRKSPLQSILLEELVNFLASMLRLAGVSLIFETWYSMEKMIETFHESNCKPFFFLETIIHSILHYLCFTKKIENQTAYFVNKYIIPQEMELWQKNFSICR